MMKVTSTVWIIIIAIGAIIVTIGNIQYQIAKDRERSDAAGKKALSMLKAEFHENLIKIKDLRITISSRQVDTIGLQTNAWKIVSEGGLLIQLDEENLNRITEIYNLVEAINDYNKKLIDFSLGINSVMTNSNAQKQAIMTLMLKVIDSLEPRLERMMEKVGE